MSDRPGRADGGPGHTYTPSGADRRPARTAIVLWLALAFVTWNVVFDRGVAVEAGRFARDNVIMYQQGAAPRLIDEGYRPAVRAAGGRATLWGGGVLAVGAVAVAAARRARRWPPEETPGEGQRG